MENGITDVNCLNKDSKLWENPKLKDFLTFWFYEVEKILSGLLQQGLFMN